MNLTNIYDLPLPIYNATRAFTRARRAANVISVTELIQPPQMRRLILDHYDEITEDCSDRIWALFGSAVHHVIERGADINSLAEERMQMDVDGWTVTGQPDLLNDDGVLDDWKVPKAYAVSHGAKIEWECQLNSYAELYRQHGFEVKELRVVAILRDWSKLMAKSGGDYPQQPVVKLGVPMWEPERARAYIAERVRLHQRAAEGHFGECTPEERWARPDLWAVMKSGGKRAKRVLDNPDAAKALAGTLSTSGKKPAKHYVEFRPGANVRCADWCGAAPWCPQWAKLNNDPKMEDGDDEAVESEV